MTVRDENALVRVGEMESAGIKLFRYEAARRALAEAKRVDDVKGIRDKAVAMQVYALQAKDRTLIDDATEVRMRAEIRAGELLAEMEKNKGTRGQLKGDVPVGGSTPLPPTDPTPTLSDLGLTKTQSSRWQQMAALSQEEQEKKIAHAKEKATAAIDRAGRQTTSNPKRGNGHAKEVLQPEHIGQIDLCTMDVRARVLKAIDATQPDEWTELFVALRDELDDLEKVAAQRRDDGHHSARKSA